MERIPTKIIAMGQSPEVDDTPFVPLTFTAEQANSTVQLTKVGSPADVSLSVSYNDGKTWSAYTVGDTITLSSVGDKVCFAASSGVTNTTFASSTSAYHKFVMTGEIAASGDIASLTLNKYLYRENVISRNYCYYNMFSDCTSLTTAPALPATGLAQNCYEKMFYNCTSLTTAPALPATTLAQYCYRNMFNGCTSLTTAPALPATGLAETCYYSMFQGCTALLTAPALPATGLVSNCYYYMFYGCTNLNWVEVGITSWLSGATNNWLSGVSSTGTFRCPATLGDNSTITRGASNCPTNWTVVNI